MFANFETKNFPVRRSLVKIRIIPIVWFSDWFISHLSNDVDVLAVLYFKFLVSVLRLLVSISDGNEKLKDPGQLGRRRPEEPWLEFNFTLTIDQLRVDFLDCWKDDQYQNLHQQISIHQMFYRTIFHNLNRIVPNFEVELGTNVSSSPEDKSEFFELWDFKE